MSRGSSAVAAASLPGVRLWTGRVLEDLRAGRSCLCLLPRTPAGGADAGAVLDELLHELGDFVLLPAPGPADAADPPAAELPMPPVGPWTDTAPVLDYDDGLSAFGVRPRAGEPVPSAAASREAPAAPGRADRTARGPGAAASAPTWGRENPLPHGPAAGTPEEPGTAPAASPPGGKATPTPRPPNRTGKGPGAAASTPAPGRDAPLPHGPADGTQEPGTIAAASPPPGKATPTPGPPDQTGKEPDPAASTPAPGRDAPLPHGRVDGTPQKPGTVAYAPPPGRKATAAHSPADRTGKEPGAASASATGRDVPLPHGRAEGTRKERGTVAAALPSGGRVTATPGPTNRTGKEPDPAASTATAGRKDPLAHGRRAGWSGEGPGAAS
ncbi:hypothetical protein AB0J65_25640, partial [Streptomyces toxytricini]